MLYKIVELLKAADYKTLRFVYVYLISQHQINIHKMHKGE